MTATATPTTAGRSTLLGAADIARYRAEAAEDILEAVTFWTSRGYGVEKAISEIQRKRDGYRWVENRLREDAAERQGARC